MFEKFTDRARRVVVLAQEEARTLNHNYIGTEHILLGLIQEGEGVAARALEDLGISLSAVREQVEEVIGQGQQAPSGHIPFTPRGKKALELALREALQLGHNYIGTEHILLGLIREGDGVAAQVLVALGADLNRVRQHVIELLHGSQPAPQAPTPPAPAPAPAPAPRISSAQAGTLAALEDLAGFDRFTDQARHTVVLAHEEARLLNVNYIGTEHILLGLIAEGANTAVQVLESMGNSPVTVRARVEEIVGQGRQPAFGRFSLTPRSRTVLELALREALRLGHGYIGTEHILLGLIHEGDGVAAQVLVALGADLNRTRRQVRLVSGGRAQDPAPSLQTTDPARMPVFARFTDRSRRIVDLAEDEARRFSHNYVGTEHLLLGMLREGEGVAGATLESLGVSLDVARPLVDEIIGMGQQAPSGRIAFTPRIQWVFDQSLREATELGHAYVGTEHLLLAIVRRGDGGAVQVLTSLGIDLNLVREQDLALLNGRSLVAPPPTTPAGFDTFTNRARRVLVLTQEEANTLGHAQIEPEHLLLGLLREGEKSRAGQVSTMTDVSTTPSVATATLRFLGVDATSLLEEIKEISRELPTAPATGQIPFGAAALATLAQATQESADSGCVGTQHILLGLADADGPAARLLAARGVRPERVRAAVSALIRRSGQRAVGPVNTEPTPYDPFRYLSGEQHEPVLGRQREIQQVVEALAPGEPRITVLIGEHGVGITFIMRGLAEVARQPNAPDCIAGKDIREVDAHALIEPSADWDQATNRVGELIAYLRNLPGAIVFLRNFLNPAPGQTMQVFARALGRFPDQRVQVVAGATPAEYRAYADDPEATPMREIWVDELPQAVAADIVGELRDQVESRHQVAVPDQAISAAVRLSARYVRDRPLPGKAMDLIDGAAGVAAGRNEKGVIRETEDKLAEVRALKNTAIDVQDFETAAAHRDTEKQVLVLLPKLRRELANVLTHPVVEVTEEDVATALNGLDRADS